MDEKDDFDVQFFLPYLLNQASEVASGGFQKIYKDSYGMLRTDWRVLFHLGIYGRMTARDIGRMAQVHKTKISRAVAPGAHAVLLMNRAGWHTTDELHMPKNITPILLPPRAPELNPAENIWQYLRQTYLSNRVFEGYDEIIDAACEAWNRLIDRPWKIMSIGLRKWAHEG